MKQATLIILAVTALMMMVSCYGPSSLTSSGPRTLVLDGESITEEAMGGFVSWTCHDYSNPEGILVEVGILEVSNMGFNGFILFDGGYSGEFALYQREGLDRSWIWGTDEEPIYKFVIKTDGTGAYYDFSSVPEGESTKPNDIFKCKQR